MPVTVTKWKLQERLHAVIRNGYAFAANEFERLVHPGIGESVGAAAAGSRLGGNIGDIAAIDTSNLYPELKQLTRGMRGQPADWARRQLPTQNIQAATNQPGRDFFFGNPGQDFFPGTTETKDIGVGAKTYMKLRELIKAMGPYYQHGRQ